MSLETEKKVLGCVLNGQDAPLTELTQEDFHDAALCSAYTACLGLFESNLTISPVLVHERSGVKLEDLQEHAANAAGHTDKEVAGFTQELKRVGALRTLAKACQAAQESAGKDVKIEEVLENLEAKLYSIDNQGSGEAKDASRSLDNVIKDVLERAEKGGRPGISTGLSELDKAIIALFAGKMIVLAGRPSMGKTALADTLRRNVLTQGYGVVQFSLEMDDWDLAERELASKSGINLRKLLVATGLADEEKQRIGSLAGSQLDGRWFIDDRTYSISGIRRRARILAGRMSRAGIKLGLIIIDYLQLVGENGEGREQTVAAISRGCKLMAKELGCTVLALSQLNRACENRDDRRPLMSDLRESGAIEQDADIVAFVYREHMYDNSFPPEDCELIIRKHRNGPTGTVHLNYNPKLVAFEDRPGVPSAANVQTRSPDTVRPEGQVEGQGIQPEGGEDYPWRSSTASLPTGPDGTSVRE